MLRMFAGALLNLVPFVAALRGMVREEAFDSH
jgi:hypothetical protein